MTRVVICQECPDPSGCLREETENALDPPSPFSLWYSCTHVRDVVHISGYSRTRSCIQRWDVCQNIKALAPHENLTMLSCCRRWQRKTEYHIRDKVSFFVQFRVLSRSKFDQIFKKGAAGGLFCSGMFDLWAPGLERQVKSASCLQIRGMLHNDMCQRAHKKTQGWKKTSPVRGKNPLEM